MSAFSIREIDVEALAQRLERKEATFLVDVREPWEHQLVAFPGSVLAPLGDLREEAEDWEVPEGALVVAYCHHGVRSLSGAAILQSLGFRDVVSLAGGIDAWSRRIDPSYPRY